MSMRHVGFASSMVLMSLAGGVIAADQAVRPPVSARAALQSEDAPLVAVPGQGRQDFGLGSVHDIEEMVDVSEQILDGVVLNAEVTTPAGMKIPITRYTFEVTEWIKGAAATRTLTLSSVGTINASGDGVYSCQSVRLTPGNRYVVCTKPGSLGSNAPFMRVFQVHDGGALVADEHGNVFVGMNSEGGLAPMFRKGQEVNALVYSAAPKTSGVINGGPIDLDVVEQVAAEGDTVIASQGARPVGELLSALRACAARTPSAALGTVYPPSGKAPAPTGPLTYGGRWLGTGYHSGSIDQHVYIPDDNNFWWWADAANDWNTLVMTNPLGSDWLYGWFSGAGRANAPHAGDNVHQCGVPSDALMIAGGYGSWASHSSPNGICFNWTSGARIVEVDCFVNPVNTGDELQFRKSMVHEMGHGLRLDHEDRYVAILVSGTWRVPPNYVLGSNYTRGDDLRGVRDMLTLSNGYKPGTWLPTSWGDMATFNQCHPNWGTSGDVQNYMTSLNAYSVTQGNSVTINNMFVENRGGAPVNGAYIRWYLSANTTISSADYQVGSGYWSSFGGNAVWNGGVWTLNVGHNVPPGTYYVGWILSDMDVDEFTDNNTAIMLNNYSGGYAYRTLTVNCDTSTLPPATVSASDGTYCDRVRVTYSSVANATGYEIYRSTRNSTIFASKIADDTASPYDDFTPNPRVTYYYWVKAKTNCDVSAFSGMNSGRINPVDYNGDGFLSFEDFDDFVTDFEAGKASTDFNNDGFLTFEDFDAFVVAFQRGC